MGGGPYRTLDPKVLSRILKPRIGVLAEKSKVSDGFKTLKLLIYIYISLAFHYIPYIELPTKPGAGKALQAIAGDIGEGAGSLSWLARSFSKSLELTLKDPSGVLLMPGSFSSLVFRNGIMINQQKIDFMVACVNKFPR